MLIMVRPIYSLLLVSSPMKRTQSNQHPRCSNNTHITRHHATRSQTAVIYVPFRDHNRRSHHRRVSVLFLLLHNGNPLAVVCFPQMMLR
uniref:Putative secreted peptide n=1 Tax=Anopheles braziliensis TaxID=58242 RepID=A0A2M3ZUL4_9DIPT